MAEPEEELEPLFDYSRVQPFNVVCLDDDDYSDGPPIPSKRRKNSVSAFVMVSNGLKFWNLIQLHLLIMVTKQERMDITVKKMGRRYCKFVVEMDHCLGCCMKCSDHPHQGTQDQVGRPTKPQPRE